MKSPLPILPLIFCVGCFNNYYFSDCKKTDYLEERVFYAADPAANNPVIDYQIDTNKHPIDRQERAFEDTWLADQSFMYKYFANLYENRPRNYHGICGYSGLSMFLSFYDTYWNDYYIDENYEETTDVTSYDFENYNNYESPGVYNDILSRPSLTFEDQARAVNSNENSVEYKSKLDELYSNLVYSEISNETYLGYLFELAIDNGIINPHKDSNGNVINSGYLLGLGVNHTIMDTLISAVIDDNYYIDGTIGVSSSQITSNTQSEYSRIRNEIIEYLEFGKPVLMGGTMNNGGHLCVAYDYDETTDTIYGNLGWGPDKNHANIDNEFLHIDEYWVFNVGDYDQYYTDNYYFTDYHAYFSPYRNSVYNLIKPSDFTSLSNNSILTISGSQGYNSFLFTKQGTISKTSSSVEIAGIRPSPRQYASIGMTFNRTIERLEGLFYKHSSSDFTSSTGAEFLKSYKVVSGNGTLIENHMLWYNFMYGADNYSIVDIDPINTNSYALSYYWPGATSSTKCRMCIKGFRVLYAH